MWLCAEARLRHRGSCMTPHQCRQSQAAAPVARRSAACCAGSWKLKMATAMCRARLPLHCTAADADSTGHSTIMSWYTSCVCSPRRALAPRPAEPWFRGTPGAAAAARPSGQRSAAPTPQAVCRTGRLERLVISL